MYLGQNTMGFVQNIATADTCISPEKRLKGPLGIHPQLTKKSTEFL